MLNLRIISASAGSGKTYTLAEELRRAIQDDETVRPEAVLATTFTVKAAGELRQRVRAHLLRQGQAEAAQRLLAARIGTVHSVCLGLVRDFAFDLGRGPEVEVTDVAEGELDPRLVAAISSVVTDDELVELAGLVHRFGTEPAHGDQPARFWDWQQVIADILKLARTNGLDAEGLRRSCDLSQTFQLSLLGPPVRSARALDQKLLAALEALVAAARTSPNKGGRDLGSELAGDLTRLGRGEALPWHRWARYSKLEGKTTRDLRDLGDALAAAAAHDRHPALRRDLSRAQTLVFDLAARAIDRFHQQKTEAGVVDYADLERLALDLLDRPEVQARLREQLDLVLVDEFQDTSPIQLAIFLRLARIARQSIWVGDQKQAIFGFRGTDPALMTAVLRELGQVGQPLEHSYRSRPELIALTSDLFAPAFARDGIAERLVRLSPPPRKPFPTDLGEPVERWELCDDEATGQDAQASLAAGVRALLDDPSVRVRDLLTGSSRRAQLSDVAILSYYNGGCAQVAHALTAAGIPAAVARQSLGQTPEAEVLLASLALWASPDDTLAAATLVRFLAYPVDADGFLDQALARPRGAAFADHPVVQALRRIAVDEPGLGLLDAFDRVMAAAGLRDLCRRWGHASQRLANLESFRGYVVAYAGTSTAEETPTPAGLVRYLGENASKEAIPPGLEAVTVTTWHKAKGLEWPIVVLLPGSRRPAARDVLAASADSDRTDLDLDDPLAGRFIRYGMDPYFKQSQKLPFTGRLETSPATQAILERKQREELRLLYVIWTRARDRLVLAAPRGELIEGTVLELLGDLDDPEGDILAWGGAAPVKLRRRVLRPLSDQRLSERVELGYAVGTPREHPPAWVQPSGLSGATAVKIVREEIGPRLVVKGKPEWNLLGLAIHGFLAADRAGMGAKQRLAIAQRQLSRHGVAEALAAAEVVAAGDRLRAWSDERWPGARWRREVPLMMRMPEGSVMRGTADLVLETRAGLVVVDHKTFSGEREVGDERVADWAAQVGAYADMMRATKGRHLIGSFAHLPMLGWIVELAGAA